MNKQLHFLILIPFFLSTGIFAQIKGDYVVKVNNDTVPITLLHWTDFKIMATVNGAKTKLKAKNVLYYCIDSTYGGAGRICPTILGFKRWMFLENIVPGAVALYSITGIDRGITHSNTMGNTTYKHQEPDVTTTIWYVRKYNEPPRVYHKIWAYKRLRLMMSDCPQYLEKIKAKNHSVYDFIEDVKFYNTTCGKLESK